MYPNTFIVLCCFCTISFFSFAQNQETLTENLLNKADSLSTKGLFAEANLTYGKALPVLKKEKNWRLTIQSVIEMANNFKRQGEPVESLKLLEKYHDLSIKHLGEKDSTTALLIHKIGIAYYGQAKHQIAKDYFANALKIRESLFQENHKDIINGNLCVGTCFDMMDKPDSAMVYLERCLSLLEKPYPSLVRSLYVSLAKANQNIGEFKKAETYHLLAFNYYKENYGDNKRAMAKSYLDLSRFYQLISNWDKAISNGLLSIKTIGEIPDAHKEDKKDLIRCHINMGVAFQRKGDFSKSIEYLSKSININGGNWPYLTASSFYNLGNTYKHLGDYEKAKNSLNKALEIYLKEDDLEDSAGIYHNLGNVFQEENDHSNALKNYHQSLLNLLREFDETDLYENPDLSNLTGDNQQYFLLFLSAKSNAFLHLYSQTQNPKDLKAAHTTSQLLDQLIDRIRQSYLEDMSKSYLVKQAKPVYETAIAACLKLHEETGEAHYLQEAFRYSEKSKAIILLEQIKDAKAKQFAGIAPELIEEEKRLKSELARLETLIYQKEAAPEGEDPYSQQLIDLTNEYEDLVGVFEKENQDYHQLKYQVEPIGFEKVQSKLLREGQELLEFFVGEESVFVFQISKEDKNVHQFAIDFPLREWVDSLRQSIYYCRTTSEKESRDFCEALDQQYSEMAFKLYQRLLAPIYEKDLPEKLILIPDGVLGYIPFDALLKERISADQTTAFNQYPYLALETQISYCYSATLLKEMLEEGRSAKENQLLSFAPSFNTQEKGLDQLIAQNRAIGNRGKLAPLLFNVEETERIQNLSGGKAFYGEEATKDNFLKNAPLYRYLHISSHGKMMDEAADFSFISFSQEGDSTNFEELLYLRELYEMDLNTDLVVLSACETGIGQLQNGEGIMSLARGFSYAGAKSILTTLWSVNDQKTADLMVSTFEHLEEGKMKDEALYLSKKAYIQNSSAALAHPFYWAGFIPIGNMEVVEIGANDWMLWVGMGALLLGLLGFLGRRKRTEASV